MKQKRSKNLISWRPSWISANEWLEKNGTNSSFKVKGVKILKSLGVKNIAKIPTGLHNPYTIKITEKITLVLFF